MQTPGSQRLCSLVWIAALACSGGGGGAGGAGGGAPVEEEPAIAWTQVRTAAELELCMEDPATPHCLLTDSITFTGNQTVRHLDLDLPDGALSHLRCADGVEIVWDNSDGPPATGVDVVRLTLGNAERVVIENCRVETRVGGDPEVGYPTGVQLLFARHKGLVPESVSEVTILGGAYKTAYTGPSTIALGCNCNGPTRFTLEGVRAEGPIALDAKGTSFDGTPLPWRVVDSVLTARAYDAGTPRCWKQQNDVTFVDLAGSVCEGGLLQFTELVGGSPHTHTLSGLTLRDTPMPAVPNGVMISLAAPHGLKGSVRVEGAPGAGDPADPRSQNLILSTGSAGEIDLRFEFADCHRVFSFATPTDFALNLRPGGQLQSPLRIELVGPASCPQPPQLFDRQFEVGSNFLGGGSQTVNAIRGSLVSGFARTNRSESSFTLVDGAVIPDAVAAAATAALRAPDPAGLAMREPEVAMGVAPASRVPIAASEGIRAPRAARSEVGGAAASTASRHLRGATPAQVPALPGMLLPSATFGLLLGIGLRARLRRRPPIARPGKRPR